MRFSDFLIIESKQEIVNLGYPPLIASLFYQRFGNLAFLIARWYKDYKFAKDDKNWFRNTQGSIFKDKSNLYDLCLMYDATKDSDSYRKILDFLDLQQDGDVYDDYYLADQKANIKQEIEETLFGEVFFTRYGLIEEIVAGRLTNIAPYKDLSFWEAQKKFDKKRVFQELEPLKTYPNGYRWIDVGKRCYLVGSLMKNCGSTGVMSMDADSTMVVLFDKYNKPHVVVTYSPNQKRISGDEGAASTEVKSMYHDYVLDLAKHLGVDFDANKSKSKFLKIKYLLKGKLRDIEKLRSTSPFSEFFKREFFKFSTTTGGVYYTDGFSVLSELDLMKVKNFPFKRKTGYLLGNVFNSLNKNDIGHLVNFVPIEVFSTAI